MVQLAKLTKYQNTNNKKITKNFTHFDRACDGANQEI